MTTITHCIRRPPVWAVKRSVWNCQILKQLDLKTCKYLLIKFSSKLWIQASTCKNRGLTKIGNSLTSELQPGPWGLVRKTKFYSRKSNWYSNTRLVVFYVRQSRAILSKLLDYLFQNSMTLSSVKSSSLWKKHGMFRNAHPNGCSRWITVTTDFLPAKLILKYQ